MSLVFNSTRFSYSIKCWNTISFCVRLFDYLKWTLIIDIWQLSKKFGNQRVLIMRGNVLNILVYSEISKHVCACLHNWYTGYLDICTMSLKHVSDKSTLRNKRCKHNVYWLLLSVHKVFDNLDYNMITNINHWLKLWPQRIGQKLTRIRFIRIYTH